MDRKNAGELTAELAGIGGALMIDVLDRIGEIVPAPQPEEGVTSAAKIEKAEAKLDFSRPADEVERQVRAFNPAPGAYFEYGNERIKILAADIVDAFGAAANVLDMDLTIGCNGGAIRPTLVQRAGRGAMAPSELLRGFSIPPGAVLS